MSGVLTPSVDAPATVASPLSPSVVRAVEVWWRWGVAVTVQMRGALAGAPALARTLVDLPEPTELAVAPPPVRSAADLDAARFALYPVIDAMPLGRLLRLDPPGGGFTEGDLDLVEALTDESVPLVVTVPVAAEEAGAWARRLSRLGVVVRLAGPSRSPWDTGGLAERRLAALAEALEGEERGVRVASGDIRLQRLLARTYPRVSLEGRPATLGPLATCRPPLRRLFNRDVSSRVSLPVGDGLRRRDAGGTWPNH